uniref:Uncharacterized protein n=1 Tax=Rhizophora mucronata TaxID=61149 RepID=A0A2P2PMX9_RHIMU
MLILLLNLFYADEEDGMIVHERIAKGKSIPIHKEALFMIQAYDL